MGQVSAAEFFGGSYQVSVGTGLTALHTRRWALWTFTASGQTLTLPAAAGAHIPIGMWVQVIINGGTNTFTLEDQEGEFSISVAQDEAVILGKTLDASGDERWTADKREVLA